MLIYWRCVLSACMHKSLIIVQLPRRHQQSRRALNPTWSTWANLGPTRETLIHSETSATLEPTSKTKSSAWQWALHHWLCIRPMTVNQYLTFRWANWRSTWSQLGSNFIWKVASIALTASKNSFTWPLLVMIYNISIDRAGYWSARLVRRFPFSRHSVADGRRCNTQWFSTALMRQLQAISTPAAIRLYKRMSHVFCSITFCFVACTYRYIHMHYTCLCLHACTSGIY